MFCKVLPLQRELPAKITWTSTSPIIVPRSYTSIITHRTASFHGGVRTLNVGSATDAELFMSVTLKSSRTVYVFSLCVSAGLSWLGPVCSRWICSSLFCSSRRRAHSFSAQLFFHVAAHQSWTPSTLISFHLYTLCLYLQYLLKPPYL